MDKTRQISPAMAAKVETRLWAMEDMVRLIDEHTDRNTPRLADQLVA